MNTISYLKLLKLKYKEETKKNVHIFHEHYRSLVLRLSTVFQFVLLKLLHNLPDQIRSYTEQLVTLNKVSFVAALFTQNMKHLHISIHWMQISF